MFYKRKMEHSEQEKEMLGKFLEDLLGQLNRNRTKNEEVMTAYSVGRQALSNDTFIVIEDADTKVKGVYVKGIPFELMETWFYKGVYM